MVKTANLMKNFGKNFRSPSGAVWPLKNQVWPPNSDGVRDRRPETAAAFLLHCVLKRLRPVPSAPAAARASDFRSEGFAQPEFRRKSSKFSRTKTLRWKAPVATGDPPRHLPRCKTLPCRHPREFAGADKKSKNSPKSCQKRRGWRAKNSRLGIATSHPRGGSEM